MQLSHLLNDTFNLPPEADTAINAITLDSRQVQKGAAFFALPGIQTDGRIYIDQAIAQGAKAIITSTTLEYPCLTWQQSIPIIALPHLQQQLAHLAAIFYGFPATKLKLIGVTGTSG